jgi:hypothetical protein
MAFLLYAALAVAWAAPASLSPASTLPDLGDPLHLSYVMAWDAHQVVRHPFALFDSNSFYPYPHSLAFGDHLLPEAMSVAPVFWVTGNAVLASNVAVWLALTLSALAMFLLVRHLTGSTPAALLAGTMYAFNSFTRHELLRVHVLNLEWWPLAMLALDLLVRHHRPRAAILLAVAMTLAGLSGSYYLIYSMLIGPLWLVGGFALGRRWPTRQELTVLVLALALCAIASAALLWPYLAQLQTLSFEKSWAAGADVLAYLDPEPASPLGHLVELLPRHSEVPHFLGLLGLLLILGGIVHVCRHPLGANGIGVLALVTALVGFTLSLGPTVAVGGTPLMTGPYKLLYDHVRLVRGMAGPERVGVLVILGASILAGLGIAPVLARMRSRGAVAAVLGVLLLAEHWTSPIAAADVPTGRRVPSVYRWLAADSRDPLIELPLFSERAKRLRAAYLYFSTYHWRPIPIGRTSFYPPAHDYLAWNLSGFPDDVSIALLQRLGIGTIVVHPYAWPEVEREARLGRLAAEPRLQLVRQFDDPAAADSPLELGRERVYRLAAPETQASAPCTPADELPRGEWTIRHSGRKKPDLVRDGDRRTAWFTQIPQRPDDFFEVTFAAPHDVAAVVIEMYYPHDEFPRNLLVFGSEDASTWRRIPYADGPNERWATLDALVHRPQDARLVYRIPQQALRGVSLRIAPREHEEAWPQWSIPELRMYASCR